MATIYLIDASPYIFRAYFSLPGSITTPQGETVNAVYGFTEFLIQVLKKENPSHIGVAFDGSLTTSFRNEIYPPYKAQRALPPPELEAQIDTCLEVTKAMGMPAFIDDRYEADDIIATLAKQFQRNRHRLVVVSGDKDFAQLVGDAVRLWDFARDKWYDAETVKQQFGVAPEQIVDYLALTGDSVDNIPGVPGIGPKTAAALLNEFRSLERLYDNLDAIEGLSIRGAGAIKQKLIQDRETAELSKKLVQLAYEAPAQADLQRFTYRGADPQTIDPIFEELGFDRIRERIPKWLTDAGKIS